MTTFQEHLQEREQFEHKADYVIDAFEAVGAIETNLGRSSNFFEEFTFEPDLMRHGGKAPDGYIYIKTKRWVGDWQESEHLLVPMNLLDETCKETIKERATAIAQKIVDAREAEKQRAKQTAEAERTAQERAKLLELAARHPDLLPNAK